MGRTPQGNKVTLVTYDAYNLNDEKITKQHMENHDHSDANLQTQHWQLYEQQVNVAQCNTGSVGFFAGAQYKVLRAGFEVANQLCQNYSWWRYSLIDHTSYGLSGFYVNAYDWVGTGSGDTKLQYQVCYSWHCPWWQFKDTKSVDITMFQGYGNWITTHGVVRKIRFRMAKYMNYSYYIKYNFTVTT